MLNRPAVPDTFIIILKPNALNKTRWSTLFSLNLLAKLKYKVILRYDYFILESFVLKII